MKQTGLLTLALLLACASPVFAEGMDLSTGNSEFMRGQRPLDAGLGWNGTLGGSGAQNAETHSGQQDVDALYEDLMREESLRNGGTQAMPSARPSGNGLR